MTSQKDSPETAPESKKAETGTSKDNIKEKATEAKAAEAASDGASTAAKAKSAGADDKGAAEEADESKKKKRKFFKRPINKKKAGIAAAVIVVVVAVGGIGFYNWHNTPEFCDAICHNPQDPFNPTLYAEPGQSATDKWGNEVADASGMLASVHHAYANKTCMDCHEPTMQEQITEGLEWATGNFYNPLSERSLTDLVRWHDGKEATSFCMNENCHNYGKAGLTQRTANLTRNPHSWHHNEYTCSDCHKSHRASVMICSQCHTDYTLPEGWITYQEAQELENQYPSYSNEQKIYG